MSAIGISVWTFGLALGVMALGAAVMERGAMLRTAFALLANWAAHIAYWRINQDPSPYVFSAVADTLTAVIILNRPAGRMQALIGWTLLIQITIHFAYCSHLLIGGYQVEGESNYWAWLDWIALAQLVLAGGWTIDGAWRHLRGDSAGGSRHHTHADDSQGVVSP